MKEKRNAILTILVILFILGVFSAASLAQEDKYYSQTEGRVLESKPQFSPAAFFAEDYADRYEAYERDQFVSRDKWLAIKTAMDLLTGKKEIRGVYIGEDDTLFDVHHQEDFSRVAIEESLDLLETLVGHWDARVMLVPSADAVLTDKLPNNAPTFDQREYLEQVVECVGEENYIDIYSVLLRNRDNGMYYRTDKHWTSRAAFLGYQTWAAAMGRQEFPYEVYEWETATDSFLGSVQAKVNLDAKADSLEYMPKTDNRLESVVYDFRNEGNSLYNLDWLETTNPYGIFLDDNHVFTEITTGSSNGKALFVVKDSFGNSMIPYLLPYYDKIYVLDLYSFNGAPGDFIKHYQSAYSSMDVLVICGVPEFILGEE